MEVLEKSAVKSDLLLKLRINETNYGSSSDDKLLARIGNK
jgi:hypothetical protein